MEGKEIKAIFTPKKHLLTDRENNGCRLSKSREGQVILAQIVRYSSIIKTISS